MNEAISRPTGSCWRQTLDESLGWMEQQMKINDAQKQIEQLGYFNNIEFTESDNEYFYFQALDEDKDVVYLRVSNDEEMFVDKSEEQDIESLYDGGIWTIV